MNDREARKLIAAAVHERTQADLLAERVPLVEAQVQRAEDAVKAAKQEAKDAKADADAQRERADAAAKALEEIPAELAEQLKSEIGAVHNAHAEPAKISATAGGQG